MSIVSGPVAGAYTDENRAPPPVMQGEAIMASNVKNPLSPLIRRLESIASLSDEARGAIKSLPVTVRELRPHQGIVHDGDIASQCCVILKGWACRYKIISGGKRQIFSFHIAGDIPDQQGLYIPLIDHSLATMTAATVGFTPHEHMRDLTFHYPGIAAVLSRDTFVEAAIFREWMIGMGRRTAFGQMAHLFCELYIRQEAVGLAGNQRCPLPITQVDLADATGLSNLHVNRVLQEMRGKGMITLRSSTLMIHAWDELVQAAEFDGTYPHLERHSRGLSRRGFREGA